MIFVAPFEIAGPADCGQSVSQQSPPKSSRLYLAAVATARKGTAWNCITGTSEQCTDAGADSISTQCGKPRHRMLRNLKLEARRFRRVGAI